MYWLHQNKKLLQELSISVENIQDYVIIFKTLFLRLVSVLGALNHGKT